MRIASVQAEDASKIDAMARLLLAGFTTVAPDAWPTFEAALEEVEDDLKRGLVRVALDENGIVLGWIGGRHSYGN